MHGPNEFNTRDCKWLHWGFHDVHIKIQLLLCSCVL